MVTTGTTAARRDTGQTWLAWVVLVAAVLEVVAPVVTANGPGSSPGDGSGPELLITPVGWAFSIWGVIYTLAIAQAIAVLVRGADAVPRRLQIDLVVLYLGGTVWIVLAGLDSSEATAGALLVMLLAAVDAVLTTSRAAIAPRWLAVLTGASVGLYAGWVTAAFFLNLSTALVDATSLEADGLGWQIVMVVIAVIALLAVLVATRGNVAYAAAGIWAMIGIAVTGSSDDTTEVLVAAVVAAVVLVVTTLALHVARRRSPDPAPAA
ncbi:MFS transporter [Aeromicrobium sp. SMF47]|uniref:MFS transporter n=1 Tax=Aeromicrobium yanjiei TaxID=2662028 RepID=UPI00129DEAF6|nr:MFS transporter [Aeromicrobium yanjiei]MRJ74918.1 MFS transporter [Aeromicrobium yanjiei]